jgi:uncharacterized membrane protein YeiH
VTLLALSRAFELIAVIFAALSGIVDARRKNTDLVGAFFVGLITAFGGGTLRDVLLERRPLFWVARPEYALIVLVLAVLSLYAPRVLRPLRERRVQRLADLLDAVALGLFGALGLQIALQCEVPGFIAVLFGVMTGTFGGVLRDIVLNEVPMLFRPVGHLYATAVFAGGLVQIGALQLGVAPELAIVCGASLTILVRVTSVALGLGLPPGQPLDDG